MQNSIKYLTVGFVILATISWVVLDRKDSSMTKDEFLVPLLQSQINEIDRIEIRKNNQIIILSRIDGTWRVQQADNFIADTNNVANLLLDLRKFKLKERKTKNPDKYARLSLAGSGPDAAMVIKLSKGELEIADVSIGKQAQKSQGTYVRKNNEIQTWLSQGKLDVKLDSNDWIVTTIFDIDVLQIKSVNFESTETESFGINKISPQEQNFLLVGRKENHQLRPGIDVNSLANGLHKFSIETIVDKQELPKEKLLSVTYELFSGLQYQLSFYQKNDKYLMEVEFSNLGTNNQYEKQLTQWAYVIANYKFEALNKRLSEIVDE